MQLLESDRRAVDLLLDQGQSSTVRAGGPGYVATSVQLSSRVRHVERLLNLLEALPQEEPSDDLVDRTVKRLDADPHQHPVTPAHRPVRPLADPRRPVV